MTQLEAQLLSIAIEAPLAALIVHLAGWPSRGARHVAVASAIATAVTHPLLWAAVEALAPQYGYPSAVLGGETVVVAVEAAILAWGAGLALRFAFAVSALVNVASTAFGLFLLP